MLDIDGAASAVECVVASKPIAAANVSKDFDSFAATEVLALMLCEMDMTFSRLIDFMVYTLKLKTASLIILGVESAGIMHQRS